MVDSLYIVQQYDNDDVSLGGVVNRFNHIDEAEAWCYAKSRRDQYEYQVFRKSNKGYEFECRFFEGKQEW